ncbi:MAG: aminotransferase class I/II-fold pyridoxal phosphate-dependent enzyme [Deltaproteobacteria bacterium]|nr:aminotransferase class I/II-fold pyridoxal phosphate-dependent enzyme [Deltaproteobacteria bacterium]
MGRLPPNSINLNVRGLSQSATIAINDRSNALRAEGRTIFKLGLGQSPFPVPRPVVEALRANAHQKDYLPVKGLPQLRQAIAAHYSELAKVERTAEDVMIGPGSKELMFLLQLVFYGDLVIPSPSWVSYAPQAQIIGRRVRYVQTHRDDGWCLRADRFAELFGEDPERPTLVILNYPNNPTGYTYELDELKQLASVAREHGVLLLSDEIYGQLHHQGAHQSIAQFYPEGTIISSGLSKWCGAGGWRLGTFIFPAELRWLLDAMAVAASETFTSTAAPIQWAAVAAYQPDPEIKTYLTNSRRILRALGRWLAGRLRQVGVLCADPDGAFYAFVDFSNLRPQLALRGVTDSASLCNLLLDQAGVAMLPGADFGRPPEELTLRLAYVDFEGQQALDAVEALDPDAELSEAFLRQYCGRVLEAIDRVADWVERG